MHNKYNGQFQLFGAVQVQQDSAKPSLHSCRTAQSQADNAPGTALGQADNAPGTALGQADNAPGHH